MGQQEIKQAIDGAIDYLTANPDDARYTDSAATARLADPLGLRAEVTGPNDASMSTDMPTSVGGTNTTASPGWYLRAAEASCVATLIGMRAAQLGVALTEVEVTVDSESNDWGILGIGDDTGAGVSAGPLNTRVAARVRAPGSAEGAIREIVQWAVAHCPVTDAVRRSVPMTIEVDGVP
ncbi:MAG: OsmC family protein [Candidatus Limnocylindrales bacterium]